MADPITEKLQHLPDAPGVYLYKNQQGDILYIGKAKSLKKRVRSYFQPSTEHNLRIRLMVSLVYDVHFILTNTEAEALIVEAQLIKAHQPRYNVALKDDKSYPYFKLTLHEYYPRLFLVREAHQAKAEYFGPYPSVRDARAVMHLIDKFFLLRTSKMNLDGTKTYRPCINFQLKRCLAPCRGNIPIETYGEAVEQVRLFLKGKDQELVQRLEAQMLKSSEALDFERAAQFRDQIRAIQRTFAKQLVITPDLDDQDVFALHRQADQAGVQVLFLRNGRLLGTDFFFFKEVEQVSDENLLGQVLNRLYTGESAVIPQQILLPFPYHDQEALVEALRERNKRRVAVLVPKQGDKKRLLEMAQQNAELHFAEKQRQHVNDEQVMQQVQRMLHLRRLPVTVEAFDISNISGTNSVASMVCWKQNKAFKPGFRKFKIRTVEGPNDFASMQEVLTRRYQKCVQGLEPLPDLILIDGGKGQLNMAVRVLEELGISLDQVDLIGLAKGRTEKRRGQERGGGEDYEYVVKPYQKNEIRLLRNSAVLFFLQNIRDETHRFAITFHRQLRQKEMLHSVLEEIPGIGPRRKQALLKYFGSLKKIQTARFEELQKAPGISLPLAEAIYQFFHQASESPSQVP